MIAVTVCFIAFVALCIYAATLPPRIGEHVSRGECPLSLPENASDICYYLRAPFGPSSAYEFSTDESSFRKWAHSKGWDVREITGEPVSLARYSLLIAGEDEFGYIEISNGLVYHHSEEDRGLYVAFDRGGQRAYYAYHSR